MFEDYRLIPKNASLGDFSRVLRFRVWKGVSFWKDCDKPFVWFTQVKTAFEDTYEAIKELLRAGAWDAEIGHIFSDERMINRFLPRWWHSKEYSDKASARQVCDFYDALVTPLPDPSTYTPLLLELFDALQVNQGVKVPLAGESSRAWRPRDKTAFQLESTHWFPPDSRHERTSQSASNERVSSA